MNHSDRKGQGREEASRLASPVRRSTPALQQGQRFHKSEHGRVAVDTALSKGAHDDGPISHDDYARDDVEVVIRFADVLASGYAAYHAPLLARGAEVAENAGTILSQLVDLLNRQCGAVFDTHGTEAHSPNIDLGTRLLNPRIIGFTDILPDLELPRHLNPEAHLVVAIFAPGGRRFRLRRSRAQRKRRQHGGGTRCGRYDNTPRDDRPFDREIQ